MNLNDVVNEMARIVAMRVLGNDQEAQDMEEIQFMTDVLIAIAEGADNPQAMAAIAVKTVLPRYELGKQAATSDPEVADPVNCPECGGTDERQLPCQECEGSGWDRHPGDKCEFCGGEGKVWVPCYHN